MASGQSKPVTGVGGRVRIGLSGVQEQSWLGARPSP